MTHLLHTSSSPDHIWAARKSIFLLLSSSREDQAMQRQHDELFSTFSFLLYYFSEQGLLIQIWRFLHHQDKHLPIVNVFSKTSLKNNFFSYYFMNHACYLTHKHRLIISHLKHTHTNTYTCKYPNSLHSDQISKRKHQAAQFGCVSQCFFHLIGFKFTSLVSVRTVLLNSMMVSHVLHESSTT